MGCTSCTLAMQAFASASGAVAAHGLPGHHYLAPHGAATVGAAPVVSGPARRDDHTWRLAVVALSHKLVPHWPDASGRFLPWRGEMEDAICLLTERLRTPAHERKPVHFMCWMGVSEK